MLKQKCATYENPTCEVVYCLYTLNGMHIKAGCGYKPTATPVSPAHFMNSLLVNCYMPLHRLYKHASLLHIYYFDSRRLFGHSLGGPSVELITFLCIREVLLLDDLELSILLNKSVDHDGVVVEFGTIKPSIFVSELHCSCMLQHERWLFCIDGQTCEITFPGASIIS